MIVRVVNENWFVLGCLPKSGSFQFWILVIEFRNNRVVSLTSVTVDIWNKNIDSSIKMSMFGSEIKNRKKNQKMGRRITGRGTNNGGSNYRSYRRGRDYHYNNPDGSSFAKKGAHYHRIDKYGRSSHYNANTKQWSSGKVYKLTDRRQYRRNWFKNFNGWNFNDAQKAHQL